jgi:hypothetical protein
VKLFGAVVTLFMAIVLVVTAFMNIGSHECLIYAGLGVICASLARLEMR